MRISAGIVGILLHSCSPGEHSEDVYLGLRFCLEGTTTRLRVGWGEVLAANQKSEAWRIFGGGVRRPSRFGADKVLAILCRAYSPDATKSLRKVLLRLEATGQGHVQYSRAGSAQHRFSTLKPLAQNKLMGALAR